MKELLKFSVSLFRERYWLKLNRIKNIKTPLILGGVFIFFKAARLVKKDERDTPTNEMCFFMNFFILIALI